MKTSTTEHILDALTDVWQTTAEIAKRYGKQVRTVDHHLKQLLQAERVEHYVIRMCPDRGPAYYMSLWRKAVPGPTPLYEPLFGWDIMPLIKAYNGYTLLQEKQHVIA